jgi:hypothetical protein
MILEVATLDIGKGSCDEPTRRRIAGTNQRPIENRDSFICSLVFLTVMGRRIIPALIFVPIPISESATVFGPDKRPRRKKLASTPFGEVFARTEPR